MIASSLSTNADGSIEYLLEPSPIGPSTRVPDDVFENWTFVDTETNGLWEPIFVLEIAAQRFHRLTPVGEPFRIFLNHGVSISDAATAIHGYTTEFIQANGIDPKSAYAAFREYVGDSYVSSHYLIFDWDRVLVPELARLGESKIGNRGFCTWLLARRSLPEFRTHRLDYLREVFTLKCSRVHSAAGDVEAVVDLLSRVIFPRLSQAGFSEISSIATFSRLTPLALCRKHLAGIEISVPYLEIPYVPEVPEWKRITHERRKQEAEQQRLRDRAAELLNSGKSYPQLLLEYGMLEETPDLLFEDEIFVFTGTMLWGSRTQAEKEIVQRGGVVFKTKAMKHIDYLVLGEHPEDGWTSRNAGTKLGEAFSYKFCNPHCRLKIIRERDFVAAL